MESGNNSPVIRLLTGNKAPEKHEVVPEADSLLEAAGTCVLSQLQTTLIKSPVYFPLQQTLQVQAMWLVTMFPESSTSTGPPWVASSSSTDPPSPIRPRLATTMAEDAVCSWNGCHVTRGWQLAKGDIGFGNEHWLWEAAEAHPILTPGILTALLCRARAPPTKARPEPELSPKVGKGGARLKPGVGVALILRAELGVTVALTPELQCLSVCPEGQ